MVAEQFSKFRFKLQSRYGPLVDGILINGRTQEEAVNKLNQLYPACRILDVAVVEATRSSSKIKTPLIITKQHKNKAALKVVQAVPQIALTSSDIVDNRATNPAQIVSVVNDSNAYDHNAYNGKAIDNTVMHGTAVNHDLNGNNVINNNVINNKTIDNHTIDINTTDSNFVPAPHFVESYENIIDIISS